MNRDQVLSAINIRAELEQLLGKPQGNKYRCFRSAAHKHGDKSPSLSVSETGFWKCHTCGIKGDFFQLVMDVKGIDQKEFGNVVREYARKYGVDMSYTFKMKDKRTLKKRKVIAKSKIWNYIRRCQDAVMKTRHGGDRYVEWLKAHYGIEHSTIEKFRIGVDVNYSRVVIPIPLGSLNKEDGEINDIVNVKKHDIMRYHCHWLLYQNGEPVRDETGTHISSQTRPAEVIQSNGEWITSFGENFEWRPKWIKTGKSIGMKGHNAVYLYPMSSIMSDDDEVWLVGGELKALLLIQFGINAITFTNGEANYTDDLLQLLATRHVKIVYDIDKPGQEGAMTIAQKLAELGGTVSVGTIPPEGLPSNGDITDLLRVNNWDISCLSKIKWMPVVKEASKNPGYDKPVSKKFTPIEFRSLTDGEFLGRDVTVSGILSGKGVTPYAVPLSLRRVECRDGMANTQKKCATCVLSTCGYKMKEFKFRPDDVLSMTGLARSKLPVAIRQAVGINPKCNSAKYKVDYATVDRVIIVPPVDDVASGFYRHHSVYLITDGKSSPRENETYQFSGRITGDPKNNAYTMAVLNHEPVEGDIFSFKFSNEKHMMLKRALWTDASDPVEVMNNVVTDLSENVLFKYGVHEMITVELLSFFMPFVFRIGKKFRCHKVCPETLILGDTRVGKSTTAQDLAKHLGAGRYIDCGNFSTFVGLVGGNTDIGNARVFTWGVIPTTNGGHLTMDEANKLSLHTLGGLTNLKSSGIASRQTASGDRKTKAWVRFLSLANPRGPKPLGSYQSPVDAAIEVVGTPQDLARIDLFYVATGVKDPKIYNTVKDSSVEHRYTKEIARYHLQWAWWLDEEHIKFVNPKYVLDKSLDIVEELKGLMMIKPSESKYKIGRIAAAIATLVYSIDMNDYSVLVKDEHVDMAYNLLLSLYSSYMSGAGVKSGMLPEPIVKMLDRVKNPKFIRILTTSDPWYERDFQEVFGHENVVEFKYLAQIEFQLMTRRGQSFVPDPMFVHLLNMYINKRIGDD